MNKPVVPEKFKWEVKRENIYRRRKSLVAFNETLPGIRG